MLSCPVFTGHSDEALASRTALGLIDYEMTNVDS
jgi:hypothetical protein